MGLRQKLLQNSHFIIKCSKSELQNVLLFYHKMRQLYYKMRQLLQNVTILLQNTTFITKCISTDYMLDYEM